MALQTSGQISLNDIHLELGGTSGTEVTMGDVDVRGLINVNQGAQVAMNAFYGASDVVILDCSYVTPAVTSGKFPTKEVVMFLTTNRSDTTTDYYQTWNSTATHSSVNGSSSSPPFVGGGFFLVDNGFLYWGNVSEDSGQGVGQFTTAQLGSNSNHISGAGFEAKYNGTSVWTANTFYDDNTSNGASFRCSNSSISSGVTNGRTNASLWKLEVTEP